MKEFFAENWVFILPTILFALIWAWRTYIAPLIAENELKIQFQSMAEPVLILDDLDGSFHERKERARQRFIESGNAFAIRQIPVIAIPFQAPFVIVWFEKTYAFTTVGMNYPQYLEQSKRLYNLLYGIWLKEMTSALGEEAMYEFAKQQDPFDPANTWKIPQ